MIRHLAVFCLVASVVAFAPKTATTKSIRLDATGFEEVGGKAWDPMGFSKLNKLGEGKAKDKDLFNSLFPDDQFLQEAEIKHGRQAMLAWTGIWATHVVSINNDIKIVAHKKRRYGVSNFLTSFSQL